MLVRQSKNSFIRSTERYGYVTNQLTQFDRVYNSTGADFLREITREAKDVEDIVDHLMTIYEGVSREELKDDFVQFIQDLAKHRFVYIGDTIEDIEKQDLDFSYAENNPKTLTNTYYQETDQKVRMNTTDFRVALKLCFRAHFALGKWWEYLKILPNRQKTCNKKETIK